MSITASPFTDESGDINAARGVVNEVITFENPDEDMNTEEGQTSPDGDVVNPDEFFQG